ASQSISCTYATLAAGATATVTVTYHVAPDTVAAVVANTGVAKSDEDNDNDHSDANLTIASDAALSLVKTFTPASVAAGSGHHTFTLVVKNTGSSSTAHTVVVTDIVDNRLAVASASATGSGDCTATSGQVVSCSFATLAAGATATITVHYSVA